MTVRQPGNPIRMWDRKAGDEIIVSLNQVCLCIGRTHYQDLLLYLIPGSGIGEDNYRKWAGHLLESLNRSLLFGVSTWKFTLDELPDGQKESSAALIGKQDPGVFFSNTALPAISTMCFGTRKNIWPDSWPPAKQRSAAAG